MENILSSSGMTDIAILGVLIALFIIYAVWRNTGLLLSVSIALPIAGFVYQIFPYHENVASFLPTALAPWASLVLFCLFLLFALWILQRTIGAAFGSGRPLHIVTTSVALAVLLISFSYHVVPIENIYDFGSSFDSFFGSINTFFWVVSLALLALFVV